MDNNKHNSQLLSGVNSVQLKAELKEIRDKEQMSKRTKLQHRRLLQVKPEILHLRHELKATIQQIYKWLKLRKIMVSESTLRRTLADWRR